MSKHLQLEIEHLRDGLSQLSAAAERALLKAVKALTDQDTALAQQVIEGDRAMDRMEVELEEECLKVVALYQPVAADLRFIVAILKINNDLERVGDLAVHIAKKAIALAASSVRPIPDVFYDMVQKCRQMFRGSLDALTNLDVGLARSISRADDEVDQLNRDITTLLKREMREHPETLDSLMNVLSVCRNLERIADHASNIAEDIVYLVDGDIVRHGLRESEEPNSAGTPPTA